MTSKDPKSLIKIAREGGATETGEPLDLGMRVRELRKARDWTLEQAAGQAGLARSTLSKIENGQMSPTYEALKKLAHRIRNFRTAVVYVTGTRPSGWSHGCHQKRRRQCDGNGDL